MRFCLRVLLLFVPLLLLSGMLVFAQDEVEATNISNADIRILFTDTAVTIIVDVRDRNIPPTVGDMVFTYQPSTNIIRRFPIGNIFQAINIPWEDLSSNIVCLRVQSSDFSRTWPLDCQDENVQRFRVIVTEFDLFWWNPIAAQTNTIQILKLTDENFVRVCPGGGNPGGGFDICEFRYTISADFGEEEIAQQQREEEETVKNTVEEVRQKVSEAIEADTTETNLSTASEIIASAEELIALGSEEGYREVIGILDQAIALDPDLVEAYRLRGEANNALGKFEDAIDDFTRLTELTFRDETAYLVLGNAYASLKKYEDAIASYDEGLNIDDENELIWYHRAISQNNLGMIGEAIESLTEALKIDPQYIDGLNLRARLNARFPDYIGCIRDYQTAMDASLAKFGEVQPFMLNNQGACYTDKRLYEDAVTLLEDALDARPEGESAIIIHQNLGNTLIRLERFDEAIKIFNCMIQLINAEQNLEQSNFTPPADCPGIDVDNGEPTEEYIENETDATEESPASEEVAENEANTDEGENPDAEDTEVIIPDNRGYTGLGWAYYRDGLARENLAAITANLQRLRGSERTEVLDIAARRAQPDYDKAIAALETAIRINPEITDNQFLNPYIVLADTYVAQEDYRNARSWIEEALRLENLNTATQVELYIELADIFEAEARQASSEGDGSEAGESVTKALGILDDAFVDIDDMSPDQEAKLYMSTASLYEIINNRGRAVGQLRDALKLRDLSDATRATIYLRIANIYSNVGDYMQAREEMQNALDELADNAQVHIGMADRHAHPTIMHYGAAERSYAQAIELEPRNPLWYVRYAQFQIERDAIRRAFDWLNAVLRPEISGTYPAIRSITIVEDNPDAIDPTSLDAILTMAWLQKVLGNDDVRNSLVEQACELSPTGTEDLIQREYRARLNLSRSNIVFEC